MEKFESIFTAESAEDIVFRYMQKHGSKKGIPKTAVSCATLEYLPFVDIKSRFDFAYWYDARYLNQQEYDQAMNQYTVAHNQWQIAQQQVKANVLNARNQFQAGMLAGSSKLKEPQAPKREIYMRVERESGDITGVEAEKRQILLEPSSLPRSLRLDGYLTLINEAYIDSGAQDIDYPSLRLTFSQLETEVVEQKVADRHSSAVPANLKFELSRVDREYAVSYLPLWTVVCDGGSKKVKVFIDETNRRIFTDGESKSFSILRHLRNGILKLIDKYEPSFDDLTNTVLNKFLDLLDRKHDGDSLLEYLDDKDNVSLKDNKLSKSATAVSFKEYK